MTKAIFKNEVELKEIDKPMFFKNFQWEEPIIHITRIIEKLENANINYAIETNCKDKCQVIYIDHKDKLIAIDALEE